MGREDTSPYPLPHSMCEADGRTVHITHLLCGGMDGGDVPLMPPPKKTPPSSASGGIAGTKVIRRGEGFLPPISCSTPESGSYTLTGQHSRAVAEGMCRCGRT